MEKKDLDRWTINKHWLLVIKIGTFLLLALAIYWQIFRGTDLGKAVELFKNNISPNAWLLLLLIMVLMLVNWGFEALKWQRLINKIDSVSFASAYKAIFCGITYAVFTPNRMGEYAGRLFYIKNTNVWRAIVVTLIGSLGQILITLTAGILGLIVFMLKFQDAGNLSFLVRHTIIFLLVLPPVLSLLFYFNIGLFEHWLEHFRWLKKGITYLKIIRHYSSRELLGILNLSLLRYIAFSIQYILLLKLFGVNILWTDGFMIIAVIFLVQTIIPTITITELGVRGNVALYFLNYVSANNLAILSAAFSLWLINLIIPAITGLAFILMSKRNKTV